MKKIFLTLGVLLSGCTNNSVKKLTLVSNNEKGLVFSSCNIRPALIPCDATWLNEQTGTQVSFGIKKNYQVIDPGTYTLIGFTSLLLYENTRHSAKKLNNIATFTVKAGEVIYLGSLEFDLRKSLSIKHAIAVFDDKNNSLEYLNNYQRDLIPRLQTKLIQLSSEVMEAKKHNNISVSVTAGKSMGY